MLLLGARLELGSMLRHVGLAIFDILEAAELGKMRLALFRRHQHRGRDFVWSQGWALRRGGR